MNFLNKLFGKKIQENTKESICKVEFDQNGKFVQHEIAQGNWALKQDGQTRYYSQKGSHLFQASEILKQISSIPQLTYYVVETPDGCLGRDLNGFYTEAPIKTKNLIIESWRSQSEPVECESLKGYGDMMANQTTVAYLKKSGQYSRLVLLMKCGNCGYESPVETLPGDFVKECYCCGAKNKGHRGKVNVIQGSGMIEI